MGVKQKESEAGMWLNAPLYRMTDPSSLEKEAPDVESLWGALWSCPSVPKYFSRRSCL